MKKQSVKEVESVDEEEDENEVVTHEVLVKRIEELRDLNKDSRQAKGKATYRKLVKLLDLLGVAFKANQEKVDALEADRYALECRAEQVMGTAMMIRAKANDQYELSKRQYETVEDAWKKRDEDHRALSLFQGQLLGLARSFGFRAKPPAASQAERAITWMSENLALKPEKTEAQLEATEPHAASRIARYRYLAELENAFEKDDVKSSVTELLNRWRTELGEQ